MAYSTVDPENMSTVALIKMSFQTEGVRHANDCLISGQL